METEPLYHYKRIGFSFSVHPNRIDIVEKSGFFPAKPSSIPLKNVASVTKTISGKIILTLNDGTKREYTIGPDAERAQQVIAENL